MILPRFELVEPNTVSQACDILKHSDKAKVIAGGTDLLVNLKRKVTKADRLVSLAKIAELRETGFSDGDFLSVGPMMTIAEIAESAIVRANFPALHIAAGKLGSQQIRNRATIGGNVCTARPAGDTIGPLIAYGAMAKIGNGTSERSESFETLYKGPGQTSIRAEEVLTAVTISKPARGSHGSYIKYTIRNAMEIALVSATAVLEMQRGVCRSARVVVGAVAPTFVRCPATEEFLVGKKITEETAAEAGRLVVEVCSPITDVRASADYRRRLVQILVKRSLLEAAAKSTN